MKHLSALLGLLLLATPVYADCNADLTKASADASTTGLDVQKPRIKALFDKAKRSKERLDERACADAIKGLNQWMGKPQQP